MAVVEALACRERRPLTTGCLAPPASNERRRLSGRLLVRSTPKTKLGDEGTVTLDILIVEVVQQPAALAHHHQQTSSTVVVLLMGPQMIGEVIDPLGEQRDLDLG